MVFPPTKLGISKGKLPAMDKGKILEKARQEGILGIDEGTKGRKDLGSVLGRTAFIAAYIVIALFSLITSTQLNMGITAMFMASLTGEAFSEWRLSKKKIYGFLFLVGAATTISALIITICDMYGTTA